MLNYIPKKLCVDIPYPFKVEMAKFRFFDAVGDELGSWFKANYRLEKVVEGVDISVLNLKEVITHFKDFAGSKIVVGAFHNVITRLCGKRVDGSGDYFINRNDYMFCRDM